MTSIASCLLILLAVSMIINIKLITQVHTYWQTLRHLTDSEECEVRRRMRMESRQSYDS